MKERKPLQVYFMESRLNELRELSKTLDVPVSILIRMGASLVIKKYRKEFKEGISKNEDQ